MDNISIVRSIEVFYKNDKKYGAELVNEYDLPSNISTKELKKIFSDYKESFKYDPLMYDVYLIKDKHVNYLKQFVNITFDFTMYEYHLSCGTRISNY